MLVGEKEEDVAETGETGTDDRDNGRQHRVSVAADSRAGDVEGCFEEFKEAGVKHLDRSEGEDSRVGSVKAEEKVLEEDEDSTDDEGEKEEHS